MKALFLAVALILASGCAAQKIDVVTVDSINYTVETDTSDSGIITIKYTPVASLSHTLNDKVFQLNAKISAINANIQRLQDQKKEINREIRQIEKLLEGLGGVSPKSARKARTAGAPEGTTFWKWDGTDFVDPNAPTTKVSRRVLTRKQ